MSKIKLFLTDVDGCMTDGGMYYCPNGDELKRFCVYDGMGLLLLRKAGIPCGIITSEITSIVEHRAKRLHIDFLYTGVGRVIDNVTKSKLEVAQEICDQLGISLQDVCYVGDDVNDLDLLTHVGFPVCPPNAVQKIKEIPNILVLQTLGGHGAIREIAEKILAENEHE